MNDVILSYAVKTLGSPAGAGDGVFFSKDGGTTFVQVANFAAATTIYANYSLNVSEMAEDAGLAFTDDFVIRFQHTATGLTEEGGLTIDDVSLQYSTEQSGFAQFLGGDNETQGAWMGVYGVDGYYIAGKPAALPDYASIAGDSNSSEVIWEDTSSDVRGLTYRADSTVLSARTAASDDHPWSFTIDVGETESNVYLYFLDADRADRQFILQVVDAATGDRYDVQTVQNFGDGKWLGWELRGEVTFVLELLQGPEPCFRNFLHPRPRLKLKWRTT